MEPTTRTHSGRRKGSRAAGTKNAAKTSKRQRRDAVGGRDPLLDLDWERATVTVGIGDEVIATFATMAEYRAWVKAGCPAQPPATPPTARCSPDGVYWN